WSIVKVNYEPVVHHSSNLSTRGPSQQKLQPEVHHYNDLSTSGPSLKLTMNQRSITAATYQPDIHHSRNFNQRFITAVTCKQRFITAETHQPEVHDNSDPSCQILVPS
ncbi:hypothetical protein Bpfe_024171, partial [Biomphalaria pfeifferi]